MQTVYFPKGLMSVLHYVASSVQTHAIHNRAYKQTLQVAIVKHGAAVNKTSILI